MDTPTSATPTIPPLPSGRELRELLCQRLQEAQELRALIRAAEVRERAAHATRRPGRKEVRRGE